MKKVLRILIIVIILIIITLLTTIIYLISMQEKNNLANELDTKNEDMEFMEMYRFFENRDLDYVDSYENFNIANNCINTYISYAIQRNKASRAYALLDSKYKEKVTYDQFKQQYSKYKEDTTYGYRSDFMKNATNNGIHTYFVYGNIVEYPISSKSNKEEANFIVKLDFNNYTFSIIPLTDENIKNMEYTTEVTKNESNSFQLNIITEYVKTTDYYFYFIEEALINIENAFKMLDEEYRKIRFENNIEKFKQYIKENFNLEESHLELDLENYYSIESNGIKQIVCDTSKTSSIIINEKAANMFSIMLDEYTIPTKVAEERYLLSTEEEKVKENAKNIIDSLIKERYEYSYNHISQEAKAGNLATLESYKNYISQISLKGFYQTAEPSIKKNKDSYTYTVTMKNYETNIEKTIELTIKLKEGIDFTISMKIL